MARLCELLCIYWNSVLSVPANDKIQKKAGSAIKDFMELVFPADYTPGQKKKVLF